jgi:putative hydrolase of the HAD superfamily
MSSSPVAVRAVFFDLDGTLLNRKGSLPGFFRQQWERYSPLLSGTPCPEYVEVAIRFDENGYAPRQDVFTKLVDRFSLPKGLEEELLADFYSRYPKSCRLYADSLTTLSSLRQSGLRLGLITNGSVMTQAAKVECLVLTDAFDTILISEAEGVRKPDAEIFQRAAQRLRVEVEEAVHVGDNLDADVRGARNAGMRAIWCRDSAVAESTWADASVEQISEVLQVIRSWQKEAAGDPPSSTPPA